MSLKNWVVESRTMFDRYAKFAIKHKAKAGNRLDHFGQDNVIEISRFSHVYQEKGLS